MGASFIPTVPPSLTIPEESISISPTTASTLWSFSDKPYE